MTKALKNIIFDFDGVLADSFDVIHAIAQIYNPLVTRDDVVAHHDGNVYEEPVLKLTPAMTQDFRLQYRARISHSHMADAISPIALLAQDYRLFIISSNDETGIKATLEAAGCLDLFVAILGYETHTSKVEKFKMCKLEYSVDLDETVFVTDTLGDIKEANKVGVRTIAVTFGFHPRERLLPAAPYQIVDSWDEVLVCIDELTI